MPRSLYFLRPDITTSQNLALAALSYTTTINRSFKLEQIIIKASQNITETITITLDSKNGSNYDAILRKKTLNSEQDYVFRPEGKANFKKGDEIKIQCTNANEVGIVYVIIKTSEMGSQ